jgi:hypothetical protein
VAQALHPNCRRVHPETSKEKRHTHVISLKLE